MRIAAREAVGNFDLKWLVKEYPRYQNHYLIVSHALIPQLSRIEFLGHRDDLAHDSYAQALQNAKESALVDVA